MIAATARVHNLIVATRDEADFRMFEVNVLNPFKHRPEISTVDHCCDYKGRPWVGAAFFPMGLLRPLAPG